MVLVKEFEMWESVISSLRSHSTYYVQEWCKSKLISVFSRNELAVPYSAVLCCTAECFFFPLIPDVGRMVLVCL